MAIAVALGASLTAFGAAHIRAQEKAPDTSANKIAEGKALFNARCGYCHLAGGTGTLMLGRRLGKDKALLATRTDLSAEYIKKITRVGINSMPPHTRIEVPDSELDLIAAYLTRPQSERGASEPKADNFPGSYPVRE
ncbi:MAG TPA: cytochrome c [Candidatus Acidoferrales bacterium]|nr:cytochrome c [Candidatus Acidoferrales bacterium]